MNFYPYLNQIPYMAAPAARTGLFKSLFGGIKWSSILSGTQKTLGVVNQAIPLIKQAKPIVNNAKTMFKVMSEFKKAETPNIINKLKSNEYNNHNTNDYESNNYSQVNDNQTNKTTGPTFFQ